MKQMPQEGRNDVATSKIDIDTWRTLKKALRTGLSDRGFVVGDDEVVLMTRFMLEQIETSGLRVVPVKPTSEMHQAINQALDHGKRMSVTWVKQRTKQRWRYQAAIEAAPSWRRGYELDRKARNEQKEA